MLNKLHLALTFTVIGLVAACTTESDPVVGGDAGMQAGGDGDGDGDGDSTSGDGDAGTGSGTNGGDGDPAAGDGDGDPAAGDGDSDAGGGDGDGDDASTSGGDGDDAGGGGTPGGEGIFGNANGEDHAFTVTPSAVMQYGGGTDEPPTGVTLTAGDSDGATFAITVRGVGADSLELATYECVPGTSNIIQYIGATADNYQAKSSTGECSVVLTSIGDGLGDHVTGTLTATMIKQGGGDAGTLEITNGSFDIVRTMN